MSKLEDKEIITKAGLLDQGHHSGKPTVEQEFSILSVQEPPKKFLMMAELVMASTIFGLHAVSSAWWGGKRAGTTPFSSVISSTGVVGPTVLLMFRIDPVIHKMGELKKTITLFVLSVCTLEYLIGATLILLDAVGSRYKSYYQNTSICTAMFSLILAIILLYDMSAVLQKFE